MSQSPHGEASSAPKGVDPYRVPSEEEWSLFYAFVEGTADDQAARSAMQLIASSSVLRTALAMSVGDLSRSAEPDPSPASSWWAQLSEALERILAEGLPKATLVRATVGRRKQSTQAHPVKEWGRQGPTELVSSATTVALTISELGEKPTVSWSLEELDPDTIPFDHMAHWYGPAEVEIGGVELDRLVASFGSVMTVPFENLVVWFPPDQEPVAIPVTSKDTLCGAQLNTTGDLLAVASMRAKSAASHAPVGPELPFSLGLPARLAYLTIELFGLQQAGSAVLIIPHQVLSKSQESGD